MLQALTILCFSELGLFQEKKKKRKEEKATSQELSDNKKRKHKIPVENFSIDKAQQEEKTSIRWTQELKTGISFPERIIKKAGGKKLLWGSSMMKRAAVINTSSPQGSPAQPGEHTTHTCTVQKQRQGIRQEPNSIPHSTSPPFAEDFQHIVTATYGVC